MARPARFFVLTAVTLSAVLAGAGTAGVAGAAPYSDQTTLSVGSQTPTAGRSVSLSGSGFVPLEGIDLTMSPNIALGTSQADAAGNFFAAVTLPSGVTGARTITATGVLSHRSISTTVFIFAAAAAGSGPTGAGNGAAGRASGAPSGAAPGHGAAGAQGRGPAGSPPASAPKRAHTTRVIVSDRASQSGSGGQSHWAVIAVGIAGAVLLGVGAWLVIAGRRRRSA